MTPGIYQDYQDKMVGFVPVMFEGWELIPYAWATDEPQLVDFIERFPDYWQKNDAIQAWVGTSQNPDGGIYWVRLDKDAPHGHHQPVPDAG